MNSLQSEQEKAHGNNWRKWLGHLKDAKAIGLELGTFRGESAEWMIENIFSHPLSRYVCVDTFTGSREHAIAGVDCSRLELDTHQRLNRFGDRVYIKKEKTNLFLKSWTGKFDFIYVDAAHDAQNVLRDAILAFELLETGGVMIFDDYEWTTFLDPLECPKIAIDAFLSCYAKQVEVLGMGWQVAVRKTA